MGALWSTTADSGSSKREQKPLKVTLYDGFAMKKALDDAVLKITWKQHDIPENARWSYTKLAIMFVACVAACVAQFYPLPFPLNRPLLAVCVAVYFALSGVLQYITWFTDKDAIFWGVATPSRPACVIRAKMGKYEDVYQLSAECPPGTRVGACEASIGRYYRENGELVDSAVEEALQAHIFAAIRAVEGKKGK